MEKEFAGTFEGGISQFRMYVEPLGSDEIKHNFDIIKNDFGMFDPDCPDCGGDFCEIDDFTFEIGDTNLIDLSINVVLSPGSIVANILVTTKLPVPNDIIVNFDINLIFNGGRSVIVPISLTLLSGQSSVTTQLTIDEDYFDLVESTDIGNILVDTSNIDNIDIRVKSEKLIEFTTPITPRIPIVYYGKYARQSFIIDELNLLNTFVTNKIRDNYLLYDNTPGYCYLLVPNTLEQPTLFRNSNEGCTKFMIPFIKIDEINITNTNGQNLLYFVYRSFVSTRGVVDVWICD